MSFYQCFENPSIFESDLCQKCGGKCCKRNGCAYAIEDLDVITKKSIMQKLEQEASIRATFEIDNYGASPVLFLESRGKDKGPVNLFSLPMEIDRQVEFYCCLRRTKTMGCVVKYMNTPKQYF